MNLDEAKERLRIPELWAILGLPRDCRKNPCHSPFYEPTSKPSFSVFNDGRNYKDHRTGEEGSAVDFIILATGLSRKAACLKFIELAGGGQSSLSIKKTPPRAAQEREKPKLPPMDSGTEDELRQLAARRHLDINALRVAQSLKLLTFATLKEKRAWIVTDGEGFNAQARRLDGGTWEHLNGSKAYTLPGCHAAWPVGLAVAVNYPAIIFCEGAPDFLAGFHFLVEPGKATGYGARLADVCPVAMLGAGLRIPDDALPLFTGKRVRIIPHVDSAGEAGAAHWIAQLQSAGANVDLFDLAGLRKADGSPVKDLNDCAQIRPDDAAQLEGLLP